MNIYLVAILTILIGEYVLDLAVERLNVKNASPILPKEFEGYFDADKYKKAQGYLIDTTNFNLINETFFTFATLAFILSGAFNLIDRFARSFNFGSITTGLIFAAAILLIAWLLSIPFSVYRTFVIEEKYGFNRTSRKTFILDILKDTALGAIIGGLLFSIVLWFFDKTGKLAWIYCFLVVSIFQIFLVFIAPVIILPIFNKFTPLEECPLKEAVMQYLKAQDFKIRGVFKMDASRRSVKSNAFFTGIGSFRRIVLFDTLIKRHSVDELICVLAHEIGHYKKAHILKRIIISLVATWIMFFLLSCFINNPGLFTAFKMESISIYASLILFAFLYNPIMLILTVIVNSISRKNEYEADKFAVLTLNKPEAFIAALKKLSVDNLSNLTPHPLKVFFGYSHPPVLKRIEAIKKMQNSL